MMLAAVLVATLTTTSVGFERTLPPAPPELWTVAWARLLVEPETLEWKPREYAGPATEQGSSTVVVGTRDGLLRALNAKGDPIWVFKAGAPFQAPPLIAGGVVYAGCDNGLIFGIELRSGKERWRYDTQEPIGATPVLAGGLLLVATQQDTLFAVDAKTGAWKWHRRRETAGAGFTIHGAAAPAVLSGNVVAMAYSDGTVAALAMETGKVIWEERVAPSGNNLDIDSTPQVSGSRLFVAAFSGAVYALEASTGKAIWEFKTPGACQLKLSGNRLFAVTTSRVLALDPSDGKEIWSTPIEGSPAGEPMVARGQLLVPSGAGLIWLDAATGRVLRILNPGTGVSSRAAVQGRRVYVLSNRGMLIALDLP